MLSPKSADIPKLYAEALSAQQAGRTTEALALYRAILLARPDTAEALFQIGRIEAAAGRRAEAVTALEAARKIKPQEPAIWQALHAVAEGPARVKLEKDAARAKIVLGSEADLQRARTLLERGEVDAAEAEAMRLARMAPQAFWPVLTVGLARAARGEWGGALKPLEVAHQRDPGNRQAQLLLGTALMRNGRPRAAEALLSEVVDGRPPAQVPLARLLRETCRPDEALALLDPLQARFSNDRAFQAELARAAGQVGDGKQARAAAARIVKLGGDLVGTYREVAMALEEAGAVAEAKASVEAALARAPGAPDLLTHRGQLRQSDGDLAGAEVDLLAALKANPREAEAARAYVNGRRITQGDPVAEAVRVALTRTDLSTHGRAVFQFAAAKIAQDLGEAGAVFSHLSVGNRLMAEAYPYDFGADLAEARALVADWETLEPMRSTGPADPVLFVTGLPRSGTTLIESILAAHSRVSAGGEMPFLNRALVPAYEALRAGDASAEIFAEAGERYLRSARRRCGADKVIADKAISTFSRIGHAARALPGARFVLIRRDPRDVGFSLYRNLFPGGMHRYAYDLTAMGRYIRLHDAITAFWAEALPERVHVVDYEALTAAPEPEIRRLLEFAGLDWEEACLHPDRAERRVQTLSFAQVRQPIGRGAVAGWRRHEEELAPLIAALETPVDLTGGA